MAIQAFISHSSKQKDFVIKLRKEFGADQLIVDTYDLDAAYHTMDEIMENIDSSCVFVFLITAESLESDWCRNEVIKAKKNAENGKLKLFLPYIIDPDINKEHVRKDFDWIVSEETYNLKFFRNPKMLAHDLELKFRRLERESIWKDKHPDDLFVGRNDKIDEFQSKRTLKRKATTLIVSGRSGSGRHRFCRRCAEDISRRERFFMERLSLPTNATLPEFLTMLNNLTGTMTEAYLTDILNGEEKYQIDAAVEILNEIYGYHGLVVIDDNKLIVDYKSEMPDWFLKLIEHPDLDPKLGIYLVSSSMLRSHYEHTYKKLISISLSELSKEDRIKILSEYIDIYNPNSDVEVEDLEAFADALIQSPAQLHEIARIIAVNGIGEARRNLEKIRYDGDKKIGNLLELAASNQTAKEFLTLLAEPGMLSYEDIKNIYGEKYSELEPLLEELISSSLIHESGSSSSLICIDTGVGDYIIRNKQKISKDLRQRLDAYIDHLVKNNPLLSEDPSAYMLLCRKSLEDGRITAKDILLPSIPLNYLISLYRTGKHYEEVIQMCRQLLNNGMQTPLKDDLKQEILHWECLSYACLKKENEFFNCLQDVKDKASQEFLKGFYFNRSGNNDYDKAVTHLQKALKIVPAMRVAKREIVKAYINLKRYDDALGYAKENYEREPENSYFIIAYHKCLLLKRKRTPEDEKRMDELMERVENGHLPDKNILCDGMRLARFVRTPGKSIAEKLEATEKLMRKYPNNKYISDVCGESKAYLRN